MTFAVNLEKDGLTTFSCDSGKETEGKVHPMEVKIRKPVRNKFILGAILIDSKFVIYDEFRL